MNETVKTGRQPVPVALVEDDVPFREYIATLISASGAGDVVLQAATVEAALQRKSSPVPRVLLLDIDLPGESGAGAVRHFLAAWPGVSVIMLSGLDRDEVIMEAIRAGASGYLRKDAASGDVLAAIEDVLAGGAPMSPSIARRVLVLLRDGASEAKAAPVEAKSPPLPKLSERERQVVALVAAGLGDKEIADQLGTAVSTVKNQLASVYAKWRVRSRTEAAVKFAKATGP